MLSKNILPAAGFCLLGLVFAHHPMLFSGLGRIQINHEDPRLINYLLEHGYQWLRGNPVHRDIWSPPIFFPVPHALAFSDSLLSAGPLYWPWRVVGIPPDTSFQFWMMTCFAVDNLLFFALLRSVFGLRPVPSAMGAFLFAFGGSRVTDIGHPQLLPHFFSVLAIFAVARIFQDGGLSRRQRMIRWSVAGLTVVAQLYASFYMGWFLILATALALVWSLASRFTRRTLLDVLGRDWLLILGASIVPAILAVILLARYLEVARVTGYRSEMEVMLAVPQLKSWIYMGPSSWLYGWMPGLPLFMDYGDLEAAHRIGIGWITPLVCLSGLMLGRDRPSVRLLALAGLSLFAFVTRFPHWLIAGVALGCWMLCPVAYLESRGQPREQACAIVLFGCLSWLLFPWIALLPAFAIIVLAAVLNKARTFRSQQMLDDLTAVGICILPALSTFLDFPPILCTGISLALAVVLMHRRSGLKLVPSSPIMILPALLASAALLVTLGELNLWKLVYAYVPGGAAIRVTSRACLLLLVPMSIGFAMFWDCRGMRTRRAGLVSLALFCVLEQGMTTTTYSKEETRNRVRAIASRLRDGEAFQAFFYSSKRPGLPNWNDHVDAMWAGLACGIPTINGYSGQMPPRWAPLYDLAVRGNVDSARVRRALLDWSGATGLRADRVAWVVDGQDLETIAIGSIRGPGSEPQRSASREGGAVGPDRP